MKVVIVVALTLDGFIAQKPGQTSLEWTSKEDTKRFVRLTKEAGTIVMGSTTFATIGKPLPNRRNIIYTTHTDKFEGTEVETTTEDPIALVHRLEDEGVETLAVCGGGHIYDMFLRAGVVDEIYATIEPVLFGNGVKLLSDDLHAKLELLHVEQPNENSLFLHYKVQK